MPDGKIPMASPPTHRMALPCPHTRPDNHINENLAGYVMVVQTCGCGAARVLYPTEIPPRATEWCGEQPRALRDPTERVLRTPPTMEGN